MADDASTPPPPPPPLASSSVPVSEILTPSAVEDLPKDSPTTLKGMSASSDLPGPAAASISSHLTPLSSTDCPPPAPQSSGPKAETTTSTANPQIAPTSLDGTSRYSEAIHYDPSEDLSKTSASHPPPDPSLPRIELPPPSAASTAQGPGLLQQPIQRPPLTEAHTAPGDIQTKSDMSLADPQPNAVAPRPFMPAGPQSSFTSSSATNPDIMAKMRAFHQSRQSGPLSGGPRPLASPTPSLGLPMGRLPGGIPASGLRSPMPVPISGSAGALRLPGGLPAPRPLPAGAVSSPGPVIAPKKMSLREKRAMNLPGGLPGALPPVDKSATTADTDNPNGSMFNKFSEFVDTKTGTLKFAGKATIHGSGIDFSSGSSFSISLDEVDNLDELGKGNYGTVYKVRHSRPKMRRPGMGLRGNRMPTHLQSSQDSQSSLESLSASGDASRSGLSGVVMAMKEIRLELDEAKFAAIIMELDILHRCTSPFIIDFYGAFFQEGAVYICMEFMDGGSVDKLYGDGVPEGVLRKITLSTIMGLKSLKDDHNIIHRDVKPTNVLVNTRGQVKLCDFGVSGNLVASIAKTNIGCQSYMAPERISGGGVAQAGSSGGTYSVQSDIWSLGLSILECAMGRYPYPPETYNNIFGQLNAIVEGEPPELPREGFSDAAHKFVAACLHKNPKLRPSYATLLRHPWLAPLMQIPTIAEDEEEPAEITSKDPNDTSDEEVASWVKAAIAKKAAGSLKMAAKPALHAAALDSVSAAQVPVKTEEMAAA